MKLSSILSCLLIVIMMSGCGQAVYRLKTDSPAKMGMEEARDALELSLSLAQKSTGTESIELRGDELVMRKPMQPLARYMTAGYDDILQEVWKHGKSFTVGVYFSNYHIKQMEILYWKSEEDAKSFVDAAYALRPTRFRKDHDKTKIAALPTPSSQKDVPREAPEPTKFTQQRESTAPVSEKGKPASPPLSAESTSTKSPSIVSAGKAPPKITITSPDVTRSLKVVARQSRITVAGVAESKIGITEVTVNGLQAELDESGNFSADIPLKVGQNTIVVAAVDILKNKTANQFTLHRGGGKVAHVKGEDSALEPGIPTAKYHALFIAVEDYESNDITKLDYAISDARRLRDVLVSNYTFEKENTILLENPDRKTIYKTLQGLRSKLTEKDNLLIFYAGHGYWQDDMKQGFWLPRDASGINDPSDWIPNSNIRDYIKAIKAKHILLIADACFSGGMFKVRDAFPGRQVSIEKIYEQPSRKAITSGSLKTVPDRSVFLEFLAKRLGENNDMYLDTQKLFTSLREAVINNSPIHQTPLYGAIGETGDEGGDFIFIKRQ
jgi:hypothetical protein